MCVYISLHMIYIYIYIQYSGAEAPAAVANLERQIVRPNGTAGECLFHKDIERVRSQFRFGLF